MGTQLLLLPSEVTRGGSCPWHSSQGAAGAPLRGPNLQGTDPAVTPAAGPREAQPRGKFPRVFQQRWHLGTLPGAARAGGPDGQVRAVTLWLQE